MGIDDLQKSLHRQLGNQFRGLITYDSSTCQVEYLRDDIDDRNIETQSSKIVDRLEQEATPAEENAFPLGDLHATLRYFDEAIVLHFPTDQQGGVVVSMEPDVARQFNDFVNSCRQELRSFHRSGEGESTSSE